MKRSHAPIFWLLFGGGGMLAALFGTALVLVTGIVVPITGSDVLAYPRMLALAQSIVGKAFVLAVIVLFAWHAAHRILCSLHDVGIHKGLVAKLTCYGAAMLLSLVAAASLWRVGF